jgi:serine/threonine protein kinase
MTFETGKQCGHWTILKSLGSGMWGNVYKAYDSQMDEIVALKVAPLPSDSKVRARLERESKVAQELRHDGLVAAKGPMKISDDHAYIPMEFIHGFTLDSVLKMLQNQSRGVRRGLSVTKVVELGVELLNALSYLHNSGIVHRDLHAGNVMISREGYLKLTDYGTVKDLTNRFSPDAYTFRPIGGSLVSSYEQLVSPQRVTSSSDLYSVGVLMYHAITLRFPYFVTENSSIFDLAKIVYSGKHTHISELTYPALDGELADDIHRLLSNDPAHRGSEALSVSRRLEARLPRYRAVETRSLRARAKLLRHCAEDLARPKVASDLAWEFVVQNSAPGRFCVYGQDELELDLLPQADDSQRVRHAKRRALSFIKKTRQRLRTSPPTSKRGWLLECPLCTSNAVLWEGPGFFHVSCRSRNDSCFFDCRFFKPNLTYESRGNAIGGDQIGLG